MEKKKLCKCGCGKEVEWNKKSSRWNSFVKGHYKQRSKKEIEKLKNQEPQLCKCGCKEKAKWNKNKIRWNEYLNGHAPRKKTLELQSIINELPKEAPLCKCGCKEPVIMSTVRPEWNLYVNGHRSRLPRIYSEEGRDKIRQIGKLSKGRKHSDETKKKISDSLKGREGVIPNEETRNKMSDAKQGITPWNKGKELSEEHKEKLSLSHIDYSSTIYIDGYCKSFDKEYKEDIRIRDKHTCQLCCTKWKDRKIKRKFHIHHIDEDKLNSHPDNLITVCCSCHFKLHRWLKLKNIK